MTTHDARNSVVQHPSRFQDLTEILVDSDASPLPTRSSLWHDREPAMSSKVFSSRGASTRAPTASRLLVLWTMLRRDPKISTAPWSQGQHASSDMDRNEPTGTCTRVGDIRMVCYSIDQRLQLAGRNVSPSRVQGRKNGGNRKK